jgi:ABC-type multidrug transport system ATPase subunit
VESLYQKVITKVITKKRYHFSLNRLILFSLLYIILGGIEIAMKNKATIISEQQLQRTPHQQWVDFLTIPMSTEHKERYEEFSNFLHHSVTEYDETTERKRLYHLFAYKLTEFIRILFNKILLPNPISYVMLKAVHHGEVQAMKDFLADNDKIIEYIKEEYKLFFKKIQIKFKNEPLQIDKYERILKHFYIYKIARHLNYTKVIVSLCEVINNVNNIIHYQWLTIFEIVALYTFVHFYYMEALKLTDRMNDKTEIASRHEKKANVELDEIKNNYNVIIEAKLEDEHFDKANSLIEKYTNKKKNLFRSYQLSPEYMKFYQTMSDYQFYLSFFVRKDVISSNMYSEMTYFIDKFIQYYFELKELDVYYKREYDAVMSLDLKHVHEHNTNKISSSKELEAPQRNTEILFKIEHLTYGFNDTTLFENCSIDIQANKWMTFHGNSGCGKTTLCNLMLKQTAKVDRNKKGKILYLGKYKNYEYESIRHNISYVKPFGDLFNNSIYYNVMYGVDDKESKKEVMTGYFKKFGLSAFLDCLNKNIHCCSTGEKQRVKIVRLILQDKKVWILDEVTSNVDNDMEKVILGELRSIQKSKGKSVIHITHNIENKTFADNVLVIKNKKIMYE